MTAGLDAAVAGFRAPGLPTIRCVQLDDGPFGIETQAHVDGAGPRLAAYVAAHRAHASTAGVAPFVKHRVAGLLMDKEIHYLGMALASPPQPYIAIIGGAKVQMGVLERCVGERALDMSVAETASGEGTLARMIAVGTALRDIEKADAIVMGCAGMARHRAPLEAALGIPVIDPTQSAVAMALGALVVRGEASGPVA